jgi:hypothetical protein
MLTVQAAGGLRIAVSPAPTRGGAVWIGPHSVVVSSKQRWLAANSDN